MIHPYPFQRETTDGISRFGGRALVAMPPGSGKTMVSLLYTAENRTIRPVVVVCPASLKWEWEDQIARHFRMRSVVLSTTRPMKILPPRDFPIYIVNYDVLGQRRSTNSGPGWGGWLKGLDPQLIILDESHYLGGKSKRVKWVRALCKGVPHVIALSGTPFTNKPAQLYNTLNILRPDLFPSFFSYAFRFCSPKKNQWGWDFSGSCNLPELHKILSGKVMLRKRKEEILPDLPPKARHVLLLDMERPREYQRAMGDFLGWLRENGKSTSGPARAEGLVKLGALKQLASQLKRKSVVEWVENFLEEDEGKLILFGIHHETLRPLHEKWKKISVLIDGGVPPGKRKLLQDQFNKHPGTRLLLGNIEAAGTGWSARCSTAAFLELGWNPGDHSQCEDRIHGISRGKKGVTSTIWYLVARGSCEEDLCALLTRKQKVLDSTLDGYETEDLNIYSLLIEKLREKRR